MIRKGFNDENMSQTGVFKWHECGGRTAVDVKNRRRVLEMLNSDSRLSVRTIADWIDIDKITVHTTANLFQRYWWTTKSRGECLIRKTFCNALKETPAFLTEVGFLITAHKQSEATSEWWFLPRNAKKTEERGQPSEASPRRKLEIASWQCTQPYLLKGDRLPEAKRSRDDSSTPLQSWLDLSRLFYS